MRLASLESTQGQPIVALVDLDNESDWPVTDLLPGFTGDMIDLIRQLTEQDTQLGTPSGPDLPLSQTRPLAPISKPRRDYHRHPSRSRPCNGSTTFSEIG